MSQDQTSSRSRVIEKNLTTHQLELIRRATIWGYTPAEVCKMYDFADLQFVEEQTIRFNGRLRCRFQIPLSCRIQMCHQMKEEGKTNAEIAKLMNVNIQTIVRYLSGCQSSAKLGNAMRHWSEILESLHGDRPLNVSSPVFKPNRKTAKIHEKNLNVLAKEKLASQDYKHRLQAVGH